MAKKRKNGKNGKAAPGESPARVQPAENEWLDIPTLETWLWDAACAVRGPVDAPRFKDYILPLIFYKRLSDVFDDELARISADQFDGDTDLAREIIDADHAAALRENRSPIVRCYIPGKYDWNAIRNHPANGKLGEFITDAMRKVATLNPSFDGVLNVIDYGARQAGHRILDEDRLSDLVEVISRHRLGLKNTSPDVLGHAYEYLLRKFAEGQGQSAGEFYTPMEVGRLMAKLLDPPAKMEAYDPTVGSGGLLIKLRLVYEERHPKHKAKAPRLFGQEMNPTTFALAKMNMFLHDFTDARIAIGDTFRNPQFASTGGGLKQFDFVVANPMWNQDNYDSAFYENDRYNRFAFGTPPNSSADWGWVQHIVASLNDTGRAAIVLDTGSVSRGSGGRSSSKEREIRKQFIEQDLIEGVVLLPENLFYNTNAPGIILLLNRHKNNGRRGQFMLVNASTFFVKEKPKNRLTPEGIEAVAEAYRTWKDTEKLCKVVTREELRKADYNLSPSQFIHTGEAASYRPINDIIAELREVRDARATADAALDDILAGLRLDTAGASDA